MSPSQPHHPAHETGTPHAHPAGHGEVLDLDADVVGHLDELTRWVGSHLRAEPAAVLDLGAGSGSGTLALAARFSHAEFVALDQSAEMIEHLRGAAAAAGIGPRVRAVRLDADEPWPQIGPFDLAWASSSLHHMKDPDTVLRSTFAALNTGGVLAVVEMDGLPHFLPPDAGIGRPGLEQRCRDAMVAAGWNAHPGWGPHLRRAGFELLEERTFSYLRSPAPRGAHRYARRVFANVRTHLSERLAADDLAIIDRLLDGADPESLEKRSDLVVRSARTVWVARRV